MQDLRVNFDLNMDLQFRCLFTHPKAGFRSSGVEFEFSTRTPRLVLAASDLLVDQNTSNNAVRSSIRTSGLIERLVYVGGSATFLVFMENGRVACYIEGPNSLTLVQERVISGAERSVTFAAGSRDGNYAVFCKAESSNLWCMPVSEAGALHDPYKLRSDIEGDQDNVNFVGGVVAKVRGKVATKPKLRSCPIVAIAAHDSLPLASAAYENGIIRVWDLARKEQRSHFDAQLLIAEKFIDIVMHPLSPAVVACTTLGRILTFYAKNIPFKRGNAPLLANSKTRDRNRRFQAMCFLPGYPSYLLLLTESRRVIVRLIEKGSLIVNSGRFQRASRPLALHPPSIHAPFAPKKPRTEVETTQYDIRFNKMACEPSFGLIAASTESSGDVAMFQNRANGLPEIRGPVCCGLDTSMSEDGQTMWQGSPVVAADSIIASNGVLFSYSLGSEKTSVLCTLPPGDIMRVEVARDDSGYCEAALVFLLGDDGLTQGDDYGEYESPAKYVLCTRTHGSATWNVSDTREGRSGCFLEDRGRHEQFAVLDSSGKVLSLVSFAGSGSKKGLTSTQSRRGIQRIKFQNRNPVAVFRSPFAGWNALIFHDLGSAELCVSQNAFRRAGRPEDQRDHRGITEDYAMDDGTAMTLLEGEVVIDIRWQRLPNERSGKDYFGAVLTDRRIYFVRDVLQPISRFEFQSIERVVVSFSKPSFSWVGPAVMLLYGNSLISVTVDGRSDRIAGVSHGENVTVLIAALLDRVVFSRPSPKHTLNTLSVSSRPYSQTSGLMRGIFALYSTWGSRYLPRIDEVRKVLQSHDVSQGSEELTNTLITNELAPIAYLLAVSEQGKFSSSPLRRAAFLGRLGDIRQAVSIAESEYGLLSKSDSFHAGTDLYRLFQRLMNMSFANGDFGSAQRCSRLLGKKGTLSSFVDVEGGYAAVTSVLSHARAAGDHELVKVLTLVAERSSLSSVAADSSLIPSQRELQTIRRAIQAVDMSAIPLGTMDTTCTSISSPPLGDGHAEIQARRPLLELERATPKSISDRLEMINRDFSYEPPTTQGRFPEVDIGLEEDDVNAVDSELITGGTDSAAARLGGTGDSSDEEDLFDTGGNSGVDVRERLEESGEVTDLAETEAALLRQSIQDEKKRNEPGVAEGQRQMWALVKAQHHADFGDDKAPTVRVRDMRDRGIRKLGEGRFSTAQRHFESALKTVQRSGSKGIDKPIEIIHELVYYKLVCQLKKAMEEIRTSPHANTAAGRITYLQLATALTGVPMQAQLRLDAFVEATDANMIVNNFGGAAQAMHVIKKLGVPEELRLSLRNKYAACSAKGFTDAQPQNLPVRLCFLTLRVLPVRGREFSCNLCPARFLVDSGAQLGGTCPCCGLGQIGMQ